MKWHATLPDILLVRSFDSKEQIKKIYQKMSPVTHLDAGRDE